MNRELSVSLLTALLLTFTAWAWGGVVLWTQWVVAGLGLLTLAIALLPDARSEDNRGKFLSRALVASLGLGLAVAAYFVWVDLGLLLTQRDAARQMIPGFQPDPLRFSQWGMRGLLAAVFTSLVALIVAGLLRPSESRRRLARFLPFWLGLFLFAWIACQSWNTWGVVVQRDLFWRILPREHITWLPSGLDAPFYSNEEPGGMNGWRQLLILVGPWALFCAIRAAALRRRQYAPIAFVVLLNALGVATAGNLAQANDWRSFMGLTDLELQGPLFGPFVYRNHAGAYLYACCAAAMALMFYLAKRRGEKADRGGPHLLVAMGAVFLALGAASTMSLAAVVAATVMMVIIAPAAYFLDDRLRSNLSPLPAVAIAGLAAIVVYIGILSADANQWRRKIVSKEQLLQKTGTDDRAPLRKATYLMIEVTDLQRALSGWGAGSYRWVSPGYLRTQPEFLNKKGELSRRATHAHNDWLQAIAEWGLAGLVVSVGILAFLATRVILVIKKPAAPAVTALSGALFLSLHAFYDFLLFLPILVTVAFLLAWTMAFEGGQEHDGT